MQRLEVSGAVQPLYGSLGVKGSSLFFVAGKNVNSLSLHLRRRKAFSLSLFFVDVYVAVCYLARAVCVAESDRGSLMQQCESV